MLPFKTLKLSFFSVPAAHQYVQFSIVSQTIKVVVVVLFVVVVLLIVCVVAQPQLNSTQLQLKLRLRLALFPPFPATHQ